MVLDCVFCGRSVKGLVDMFKPPQVPCDMRSDSRASDLFIFLCVACDSLPCLGFSGNANSNPVQADGVGSGQEGSARCHLEHCLSLHPSLWSGNSGQGGALRASWCAQRSAVQGGVHGKHLFIHSFIHRQIFLEYFLCPGTVLSKRGV